jgi:two-component system, cell cycle response regulator DivK
MRPRSVPQAPLCVLLVDDVPDTLDVYSRYFVFRGLKIKTARDGTEALMSVDIEPPDAIVLDLAMPKITGWDVIRELKANPATRRIPILALSGQRAEESAVKAGADGYVEKPCVPEDLLQRVMRLVRQPRAPRDQ